ncbi:MAG: glycine--tRNA ligase [Candidatus Levybacteria bacterium RIFCSPLOWO2_02_FULL_37_10]|nr:MAG: glycine--tRNA ligase [Candidatus Levybacteria bacterium RIFCSPHIGHO2_01_FULL_37_33]OGH17400.1 MAG: glycine--tRNA ligase [Candidatus Levybacteria bacterium RIFCSPHIGHO2_02_FULL_37_11]OGH30110.1 MAG: glycine--tRNA ligase [Candidatus Levybacteria bacterium RIFCSPHIGHO2_12_FULL_37_12]OGH33237.1 MAG: glycine--tRNA ligase [Candidatus Levybacteria bacterium RIFCSPLOWO2_01_FULL_36_54]OGH43291.1 MAG: glycine--tRNA ligase [Candidatus Levybacteria bacterium RIFCSPLOWO2_02_FULL_37_10]
MSDNMMEKIVALCKRRGFVFQNSEIYGGVNGIWDLGPLGVALANNIKKEWWNSMVISRNDVVGFDSSILSSPKVWEASGHLKSFTDPLIECKICHERFRADHKKEIEEHGKTHPSTGSGQAKWTDVKHFNLMFKTFLGPLDDEKNKTYLRPETAQGIFINFQNVLATTRVKIPFGIAQIGRGFRNEITTGNFLFRVREFEMMELEFFTEPGKDSEWFDYWRKERLKWYLNLGIKKENIKLVDLPKEDIAHYSKGTSEIWYNWPFMGFGELEGIANRGDYDLSQHSKFSAKELSYFDEENKKRFIPYAIEPSVGVGRAILAFLIDSYSEEKDRVVLKLHPKLSPIKAAVFPLLANKLPLAKMARAIYDNLKSSIRDSIAFDERGNIGKRYYSQDEIGTPFCITVDFQSLEDQTVTVRDRDTMKQERIKVKELSSFIKKKLD